MNYSTDVKFSNNLIKNGKTTITYSGSLFRTGSEAITLVYGFGDNWDCTTEKEMTKNEHNFSVEIDLLNYDKINFCFRNSNNIWDNNNYLNYIAPIEEPEEDYNFIINENLIPEILNNLFETDLSVYDDSAVSQEQDISDIINEDIKTVNQIEKNPVELVEDSIISEESFEIEIPEDIPVDIQEFMGEISDEPSLTNDLELAFSSVYDKSQDEKKEDIINFDMDSIVDDILSPIIEARASSEVQNYKPNIKIEELDLDENFLKFSESEQKNEEESSIAENISSEEFTNSQETVEENLVTENITSDEPTNSQEIIEESLITENITSNESTNSQEIVEESLVTENIASEEESTPLDNLGVLEDQDNSLVEVNNPLLVSPRSLNKFYILKKRIKLAVYKFFTAIPKIIESAFNEEKN